MLHDDIATRAWRQPAFIRREERAPPKPPISAREQQERATAHHECGHCAAMLLKSTCIDFISLDKNGGGRARGIPVLEQWMPAPTSILAIVACASDLIGPIAEARFKGCAVPEADDDFAAHGGRGDLKNFYGRAGELCRHDAKQVAALRTAAIEMASEICEKFWDAIELLARELYAGKFLPGYCVVEILQQIPNGRRLVHGLESQMQRPVVYHRDESRSVRTRPVKIETRSDGSRWIEHRYFGWQRLPY